MYNLYIQTLFFRPVPVHISLSCKRQMEFKETLY